MSEGVIKVYYGEGRGKTTAAIGNAIQTAIDGREAIIIQFLKGKNESKQEFFKRLEPEIKYFNFAKAEIPFEELDEEKKMEEAMNMKNGFNYGKKVIATGACDLIVLDEVLGLVDQKVISLQDIREMLGAKPDDVTVICTGRVLADEIRELADEVYNITFEK